MVLGSVDPMKASLVGRLLLHLLGIAAERARPEWTTFSWYKIRQLNRRLNRSGR